jgi:prepilin-type N-terminal cleavage/methylation domain-containing protein
MIKIKKNFSQKFTTGLTLLEMLIVIGILAVLASVTFVALNPSEQLKKARDSRRLADLRSLDKALSIYESQTMNPVMGSSTKIYLSLPDTNSSCSSYSLPPAPPGYTYACVTEANLRKTNGTGWVPVNLTSLDISSPLSALPTDPKNDSNYYYIYVTGGSWELTAKMESQQNIVGGSKDMVSTDGGDEFNRFEVGSNLYLSPWSFEFIAFPTAANSSNQPGWYKSSGSGTITVSGSGADAYARANGYIWYIWQENIPFNENAIYKMSCRVRQISDPSLGGKAIYCGWTGVAADGTTLVNYIGSNSYGSQHYAAMLGDALAADSSYSTFTGYINGWGSPNGTWGKCPNPASPCKMHQNVRYLRPLFILNYADGNGVADIDSIIITKQ